jgi:hypothetical protein
MGIAVGGTPGGDAREHPLESRNSFAFFGVDLEKSLFR